MGISILILTLDEEANLPQCLASVSWSDDVVVLDSCSTDATREIAIKSGARVIQRPFDNYANQRQYGLTEIPFKYRWVLMVDADEVVPPELADEMQSSVAECSDSVVLFRMRRRDMLMGRWIRGSSGYPTWFGRLVRIGRVTVERDVNEEYQADGDVRLLNEHLVHYPFNKGIHAWFEKHNRYSSMEAKLALERMASAIRWGDLLRRDPQARRKVLKEVLYRMPARPLIVFFGLYILRGGFLEGRAGLTFCVLRAVYEFMIDCKVRELQLRRAGMPL